MRKVHSMCVITRRPPIPSAAVVAGVAKSVDGGGAILVAFGNMKSTRIR